MPRSVEEQQLASLLLARATPGQQFDVEQMRRLRQQLDINDAGCAALLAAVLAEKVEAKKMKRERERPAFPLEGGVCLNEIGVQPAHRINRYLTHTAGDLAEAVAVDALLLGDKPLPNWDKTYFWAPPGGDRSYFQYLIFILQQLADETWAPDSKNKSSLGSQYAAIFRRGEMFDVARPGYKLPVTKLAYKVLPDNPVGVMGKRLKFIRLPGQTAEDFDGAVAEFIGMIEEQEAKQDMRPRSMAGRF